jgi:SWI/SNF-related matrix-associated actin-dependent regulator 1 of chromatin subfamily A
MQSEDRAMTVIRQPVVQRRAAPAPVVGAPVVKVRAGHGRLYVGGPSAGALRTLKGAAENARSQEIELSLTLETLRAIRQKLNVTPERMASYCTPEVLAWARAAGASESGLGEVHRRIEAGERVALPWHDARAGTPAPASAKESAVECTPAGERVWKYRAPFAHQQVMATVGCWLDGAAFLCEMGTGKTRAGIECLRHQFETGAIDVALVVAPKNVVSVWLNQLPEWGGPTLTPVALTGPVRERKDFVRRLAEGSHRGHRVVLLLNVDVLAEMRDVFEQLARRVKLAFVPDEMHKLANPNAKWTQAAMSLALVSAWRLGMTGTPIRNGAEDVWSQWYVVDLGQTFGANFVQFRREFFEEGYDGFSLDPQDGTLDEIGMRLRRRGVRYRKEDCLDLPPKMYEIVEVEMAPEQERAYVEMEETLVARLQAGPDGDEELATAATQLVAILRLTQITSGFVTNEDGAIYRFPSNPKLDALEEIVRAEYPTQQIITWAQYREDIRAIAERMRDLHPLLVQGGQSDAERGQIEPLFQSGQRRWIVGNAAAGGVGMNFQAASLATYYSQGYSLIDRLQSEDRCHRSGSEQHERVTYIDFLAKFRNGRQTIDHVIRDALEAKKEIAEVVVDLRRAIGDRSV